MAGPQSGGSVTGSQTARSDRLQARQARVAATHGPVQHSPPRALQAPLPVAELDAQEFEQADDDTGLEAAVSRTASSVRSQQNIAYQNDTAEAGQLLDRCNGTRVSLLFSHMRRYFAYLGSRVFEDERNDRAGGRTQDLTIPWRCSDL